MWKFLSHVLGRTRKMVKDPHFSILEKSRWGIKMAIITQAPINCDLGELKGIEKANLLREQEANEQWFSGIL